MILGIALEKGRLRAAVVDGTKANPVLVARERYNNPDEGHPTRSASWFHGRFEHLFQQHHPNAVAAKFHYSLSSQEDALNHAFPLGILALEAHRRGCPLHLFTKQRLQGPKNFGLAKGSSTYAWIDAIKDQKPYWDAAARDSILSAAILLP